MMTTMRVDGVTHRVWSWARGCADGEFDADERPRLRGRREVGRWHYGYVGDLAHSSGRVYALADGGYIAIGRGGPMSAYAVHSRGGQEVSGGCAVTVIGDDDDLQAWSVGRDIEWLDAAPAWTRG